MEGYRLSDSLQASLEVWRAAMNAVPPHPTHGAMIAVPIDDLATVLEVLGWTATKDGWSRPGLALKYDLLGAFVWTAAGFGNYHNADYYADLVRANIGRAETSVQRETEEAETKTSEPEGIRN